MVRFKVIFCILQLLLICNCLLLAQEAKQVEQANKLPAVEDKKSDFEDVSSDEYLNGKSIDKNQKDKSPFSSEKMRVSWGSYLQMFVVLAFMLFLIFLFFYFTKNKFRKNLMGLNGIEVLAKASLLPKQTILLVRIGPRILVLNATTDGNMRTLSEFTNQEEIDQLLSEINKNNRDNIFQTLLTRNKVLYDEESPKEDSALNKIEKQTDKLQSK